MLTVLLLFTSFLVSGQRKYDVLTKKSEISLEGKTLVGFETNFDFDRKSVRRGWWKYARKFGTPLNMTEYYKVTIPHATTDGNTDLLIYTQAVANESGTSFFLGLKEKRYEEQAQLLLLDFKKQLYIDHLVSNMDTKEMKAKELSDTYSNSITESGKESLLNDLIAIRGEIEELKERIREIEKTDPR